MYKKYKKHIKNKLSKIYKNGFTLMEILVVLMVISVLSNILIGNFRDGVAKAYDSSVKSTLSSLRSMAVDEYFSQSPYSFAQVCGGGPVDLILKKLGDNVGMINPNYQCSSRQEEWVAVFPLKTSDKYYCTDSLGNSKIVDGFLDSALDGNLNCEHATIIPQDEENDGDDEVETNPIPLEEDVELPNTNPNLTLYGLNPYEFWSPSNNPFSGNGGGANKYVEPGFQALDGEDGDITSGVIIIGPTLVSSSGPKSCRIYNYKFIYQVVDSGNLTDSKTRNVIHHKCNN